MPLAKREGEKKEKERHAARVSCFLSYTLLPQLILTEHGSDRLKNSPNKVFSTQTPHFFFTPSPSAPAASSFVFFFVCLCFPPECAHSIKTKPNKELRAGETNFEKFISQGVVFTN